mmetsp:Transcript_32072/g.80501  ORF Transcript_32072/g.80501 Transcript_32072/m.80501 type:complete len:1003 (-) Transcript_32072:44-3052(-)|eukprot:CAMPEP_0177675676 /NCGR_PEP_ID=MMETSP0447-20121125/27336_1 /TAXON_ID=0 /ORGANISM="Stygamoeba regulata, Strain BSH-02190019" /LENGTH=1002 /DNA_ID=CAMNT_0019184095 /DNA_START=128 /DNA_END=3136 /DNA_ORIENTATION=+
MSSHATGTKVPIDRPSKTRIVREKTVDLVKGKRDRRVKKAVKPKRELAPKSKHVRALVIEAWKENSLGTFFTLLHQEPLNENAVSAFKALVVMHKVLQGGPPQGLKEARLQTRLLEAIRATWQRQDDRGYSSLITPYVGVILDKIDFHQRHDFLAGNLSYQDFLSRPDPGLSVQQKLELISHMLDYQQSLLAMQSSVFQFHGEQLTEAKVSALVPLVVESWGVYTLVVHFLKDLCKVISDPDLIQYLIQRFYQQYPKLRNFYDDAGHVKYVTSMITVPVLPGDPPEFRLRDRRPRQTAPKPRPEPVYEEPVKQLNLAEMEAAIASATAPPPEPVRIAPVVAEPIMVRRVEQPQPAVVDIPPVAGSASWVSFNRGAVGTASGGESAAAKVQSAAKSEDAVSSFFERLSAPKAQMATAGTMAPQGADAVGQQRVDVNASSGQPQKKELTVNDLKVRLLKLQQLYKRERERSLKLEEQLKLKDAQIQKWKEAYAKLLMSNEAANNERQDLVEINEELSEKLERLQEERRDERRQITDRWQDSGEQSVRLALATLNNPTATGKLGALPADVLDARAALGERAEALMAALTELRNGRCSTLELGERVRAVGDSTTLLVDNVKGLWCGVAAKGGYAHDEGEEGEGEEAAAARAIPPALEAARRALFAATRHTAQGSEHLIAAAASAALEAIEGLPDSGSAGRSHAELRSLLEALLEGIEGFDRAAAQAAAESDSAAAEAVELDDTLTDRASAELAAAAKVIADAARTLLATQAQTEARSGQLTELQSRIAGAIVAAALAIAQATAKLVEHAAVVQRETADSQTETRDGQRFYKADASQWARGLISAAQNVAAETQTLVWTADSVCRAATGDAEEGGDGDGRGWWMSDEGLVAAAQGVAESTTQLVVASRVRGSSGPSQQRLETTAASVSAATKQLVEAARAAAEAAEQRSTAAEAEAASMAQISGAVARMKAVQEAKTNVLRLEKQLQQARQSLFRIRESDYHSSAPQ